MRAKVRVSARRGHNAIKKAYQSRAKAVLERTPNLTLLQANVVRILTSDNGASGVQTDLGLQINARAVVVTTGTFMRGLLHVGLVNKAGGRMGDSISTLSDSLRELGFEIGRFKTGTPCRLHGRTIDFTKCQEQLGDVPALPFTFVPHRLQHQKHDIFSLNHWADGAFHVEQLPCCISYTNQSTHDFIRQNLDKSPLYAGRIEGVGPRYCPSIEDKVVKFAEKESHQIFLEPEGRHTEEYYVNGVSTSLPFEVQFAFIRTIPGLEAADIVRPGYAVEYDFCPPQQLHATLETNRIPHLYFAGQINGTSGYEEAAAQGLVAGANAALKLLGRAPLILSRADAYIGVLIDDLVTKGTPEPYRMFTSRAEHRLILRHDNADQRLTPTARAAGLVDDDRWFHFTEKLRRLEELGQFVDSTSLEGVRLSQWLKRPENTADCLPAHILGKFPVDLWEQVETDRKYEGYIVRQNAAIDRLRNQEQRRIPADVDYNLVRGLRAETRQKLAKVRPETLGQASRISGITPADLALLSIVLEKPVKSA
jgi:tRNA uridine 5-carboxymethylaminomethyl modification enzyme